MISPETADRSVTPPPRRAAERLPATRLSPRSLESAPDASPDLLERSRHGQVPRPSGPLHLAVRPRWRRCSGVGNYLATSGDSCWPLTLAQRHLCSLGLDTATDAWRLAPALTSDDVTHTACPLGDQDSALLNEVGQRMGGGEVRLRRRLGPSHCSALARAGTRWRVVPSPPRADLEGVSGVSPSDIWAVGYPTRCSTGTVPPGRSSPSPVDAQTSTVRLHDVEMRPSGSGWSVGANADAGYILRHCPG